MLCKNRPESNLDGLLRFWPIASVLDASRCARIIGLGSAHFHTRLRSSTDGPDHIYCAAWIIFIVQSGSYLLCSLDPHWFGMDVGFWPDGSGSTYKSTSTCLPTQALHAGQPQQNWPSSPTCKSSATITLTAAYRHFQPKASTPQHTPHHYHPPRHACK